jgi:hypothetical protein
MGEILETMILGWCYMEKGLAYDREFQIDVGLCVGDGGDVLPRKR